MAWTERRISIATRMWAGDCSAGEIAAELGGVTRNAVLGMLNRRGLLGAKTKSPKPRRCDVALFPWTDDQRNDAITWFVTDGLSSAVVARKLTEKYKFKVTRCAVIGKLSRLGINDATRTEAARAAAQGAAIATRVASRAANAGARPPAAPRAARSPKAAEPVRDKVIDPASGAVISTAPAPMPAPELVVVGQAVVLADLKPHCCKYPVGPTPAQGDMHLQLFCAAPAGGTYCETHQALAYKSVTAADKAKRMSNDIKAAHRDMQVRNSRRHSTGTRAIF